MPSWVAKASGLGDTVVSWLPPRLAIRPMGAEQTVKHKPAPTISLASSWPQVHEPAEYPVAPMAPSSCCNREPVAPLFIIKLLLSSFYREHSVADTKASRIGKGVRAIAR